MIVFRSLRETALPPEGCCVALGLFDGLHLGHQAVIGAAVQKAKSLGVASCVFTFSMADALPSAKAGAARLLSGTLRETLLEQMGVDYHVRLPFEEFCHLSPEDYVHTILGDAFHAKAVFCGQNYHFGKGAAGAAADLIRLCGAVGIAASALPMTTIDGSPVSSSRIRGLVAQGDMPAARRLLGRPFAIDFEVIHGRHLGRTIESPTINQALEEDFVKPRFGVYASVSTVDGVRYPSVSNIGVKPTVGSDRVLSETYLMGYAGQLYGRRILVQYLKFIRPEMKFSSIEHLKEQIKKDCIVAKRVALPEEV